MVYSAHSLQLISVRFVLCVKLIMQLCSQVDSFSKFNNFSTLYLLGDLKTSEDDKRSDHSCQTNSDCIRNLRFPDQQVSMLCIDNQCRCPQLAFHLQGECWIQRSIGQQCTHKIQCSTISNAGCYLKNDAKFCLCNEFFHINGTTDSCVPIHKCNPVYGNNEDEIWDEQCPPGQFCREHENDDNQNEKQGFCAKSNQICSWNNLKHNGKFVKRCDSSQVTSEGDCACLLSCSPNGISCPNNMECIDSICRCREGFVLGNDEICHKLKPDVTFTSYNDTICDSIPYSYLNEVNQNESQKQCVCDAGYYSTGISCDPIPVTPNSINPDSLKNDNQILWIFIAIAVAAIVALIYAMIYFQFPDYIFRKYKQRPFFRDEREVSTSQPENVPFNQNNA